MKNAAAQHQESGDALVQARGLVKHYRIKAGALSSKKQTLKAVDGINLTVRTGETLGLVGESGCGKSTLGRLILRLEEPTAGSVTFNGTDILSLNREEMRKMRGEMQIIFQDPYSSLNPHKTVGWIISEPLRIHNKGNRKQIRETVIELMNEVGLQPETYYRYPHEFSGGQRQRIGIARALALNPSFIVADEPVSALDVSIQGQIINLLNDLQDRWNLTYLIIAHDLSVIYYISDRIAVMYLGVIMDLGPKEDFLKPPQHPYTEALVMSAPRLDVNGKRHYHEPLKGDLPSPVNPPSGCRFHTRCPYAEEICTTTVPLLEEKSPGHFMACHFR